MDNFCAILFACTFVTMTIWSFFDPMSAHTLHSTVEPAAEYVADSNYSGRGGSGYREIDKDCYRPTIISDDYTGNEAKLAFEKFRENPYYEDSILSQFLEILPTPTEEEPEEDENAMIFWDYTTDEENPVRRVYTVHEQEKEYRELSGTIRYEKKMKRAAEAAAKKAAEAAQEAAVQAKFQAEMKTMNEAINELNNMSKNNK